MSQLPIPALLLAVLIPALGSVWAWRAPDRRSAHRRGFSALLATVGAASGIVTMVLFSAAPGEFLTDPLLETATHPLLGTDVEGAIVALLASVIGAAVLAAMPRRTLSQASIVRITRSTALSLLTFYSADLLLLALAWSAVALPLRANRKFLSAGEATTLRRARMNLSLFGVLPLAVALVWWGGALHWPAGVFDIIHLGTHSVAPVAEAGIVALVVLASASRMGIAPLHGWFPTLMQRGMAPYAMTLLGPLSGAFVLLRVAPALAGGFLSELPILEVIGLASAAYLGIVAWGQREQLRYTEYLVLSQASIVFLALCTTDATTIEGGLTMWVAQGLATTGLVLAATAVHSRMGELDLQRFHGIGSRAPHLTALCFVFGIAVVGIPGTLTFVAEDIIAQGLLIPHPWLAAGFMLVTAINAIGFFRAFIYVHLGKPASAVRCPELRPAERMTMLFLAVLVVLTGVVPQLVIGPESSVAEHVVDLEHARKPTPSPRRPSRR